MGWLEKLTDWKTAALIFLSITLLFCFPLFFVLKNWGIHDWDQHFFYEAVPRQTILAFHQFPLWNPWQCSGNVMLANPQSSFLSIHFAFTLLFGEVIGTKLAIPLYLFIGLIGMWLVCRKLGMGTLSSYLPPVLLMLSGVYAIRMSVGHTNWFHIAWIPWIFFFFLKAKEQKKWILVAAFFLALIFLGGGIHPFVIAVVLLGTYTLFATIKEWKQCKATTIVPLFLIFILWIPFAAIKLVPLLAVADEMLLLEQADIQPNSIAILLDSLTKNTKATTPVYYSVDEEGNEALPWSWHEYYGYIGHIPFFLFFLATIILFRKYWDFILSAFFIFLLILSQNLFPAVWKLLFKIPFASMFHGPSRFLFAALFFLALVIGFALTLWENKGRKTATLLIFIFFFFLVADLTRVNAEFFLEGLSVEPEKITEQAEFYTVYAEEEAMYYEQYPTFLRNQGILNCYERFHVAIAGLPKMSTERIEYGDYHGEAYLYNINEPLNITFFSPNKIIVAVENKEGIVMLNQNYISGWKVKIDGKKAEILNTDDLASTEITKENKKVEFYYLPNAFIIGLVITLMAIGIGVYYFFRSKTFV